MHRPATTKAVLASLETLVSTTPSTDETELGLRYLRHLIAAERSPEIRAKRTKVAIYVSQYKLDNGVTQPGRKPGRPVKGFN